MKTVGFIGAGNMGGALARAAAKSNKCKLLITDKDKSKAKALANDIGGEYTDTNILAAASDIVFLGVKPNIIPAVIDDIKASLKRGALIVSMAAAVDIASIESSFGFDIPIIRIMPNTPCAFGEGVILYAPNAAAEAMVDTFIEVMAPAGVLDRLDERLIDAAACISGCGPAFVYMFAEALADGGVNCGLPRDKAMLYAAKTLKGAAEVMLQTGAHPAALKDAVCSPGGTTIEGVHALEAGAFRATVSEAVVAAYEKTLLMKK